MHETMENRLGSLYTRPTALLWRRRWKLGVTVKNILWSNSLTFWVAPRISVVFLCSSITMMERYPNRHKNCCFAYYFLKTVKFIQQLPDWTTNILLNSYSAIK
jgi:hypothetical protein